jgi:hypothetical protein
MKAQIVDNSRHLPRDFLDKFWIEPGDSFVAFLSRLQQHDLLFTVEVAGEPENHVNLSDAINTQLHLIEARGGPCLPRPAEGSAAGDPRKWDFLSSREQKVKPKDLRGRVQHSRKVAIIEIKTSSSIMAPIDYQIASVTKQFGIKNALRRDGGEPEKLVFIGVYNSTASAGSQPNHPQVPGIQDTAQPESKTSITMTLVKTTKTSSIPTGAIHTAFSVACQFVGRTHR